MSRVLLTGSSWVTACRLRAGAGSEAFRAATSEAVSRRCCSYGKCCGPCDSRGLGANHLNVLKVCVSCLSGFGAGALRQGHWAFRNLEARAAEPLLPISCLVLQNWKNIQSSHRMYCLTSPQLRSHYCSHPLPTRSLRSRCCYHQHLRWAVAS